MSFFIFMYCFLNIQSKPFILECTRETIPDASQLDPLAFFSSMRRICPRLQGSFLFNSHFWSPVHRRTYVDWPHGVCVVITCKIVSAIRYGSIHLEQCDIVSAILEQRWALEAHTETLIMQTQRSKCSTLVRPVSTLPNEWLGQGRNGRGNAWRLVINFETLCPPA